LLLYKHLRIFFAIKLALLVSNANLVWAQTIDSVEKERDTHRFEQLNPTRTRELSTNQAMPIVDNQQQLVDLPGMNTDDLANQIGVLIRNQNWSQLAQMIDEYQKRANADKYLVMYANGALYRQQKKYALAIKSFQDLLAGNPHLAHIRLDLALMQLEDRQFKEAITSFIQVQQDATAPDQLKTIAYKYYKHLEKAQQVSFGANANYTRNDNVNQASKEKVIWLGNLPLTKNPESLPQVGHGFNYSLSMRKPYALKGHHKLVWDADIHGVHYWDQRNYRERTLSMNPVYMFESYHQWFKVGPTIDKNWLGAKSYSMNIGAQTEWGFNIGKSNRFIPRLSYTRIRYDDKDSYRYEGKNIRRGATWIYQLNSKGAVWFGGNYSRDFLYDKTRSSSTPSIRLGGKYNVAGLNAQINVQKGKRKFAAADNLFRIVRKDDELFISVSIWHDKVNLFGFTPRITYTQREVDSNISALYSRKSSGLMLEMDFDF